MAKWSNKPLGIDADRIRNEVIAHIARVSEIIAMQAGVGGMETAGAIISYLAKHPDQIEDFMAGRTSPVDWPMGFHAHGLLTWHGQDGNIYSPEYARRAQTIRSLKSLPGPPA